MKKLTKLLTLCLVVCVMLAISACNTKPAHEFSADWQNNASDHWHDCIYEGCDETSDKAAHTFDAGEVTTPATEEAEGVITYKCTVCGYQKIDTIAKLEPVVHIHALDLVDEIPADCTESGVKAYYVCSDCGELFADADAANAIESPEVIEALGHTEVVIDAVAATCTTAGKTEGKYCSVCDETLVSQIIISANGHQNVVSEAKDPTCTENGRTEGVACSVCGVPSSIQNVVPALGHDWDSGEVTTPSTCSEKGVKTYGCNRCDETRTEEVALDKNAHSWNDGEITTASTCSSKGVKTYACIACGDTKIEYIDTDSNAHSWVDATCEAAKTCSLCRATDGSALGHNYESVVTVNPGCTEAGVRTYTCKNDSAHTYTEPVDALGHDIIIDAAVAATCTATGLTEGQHCSRCDGATVAQAVAPATGHSYDNAADADCNSCGEIRDVACTHQNTEKIDAVDATCTASGLTEGARCLSCGEITEAQRIVPAKGHTEVVDAAVAATCTASGLTEGKHCSVCNTVLVAQTATNALGHTEVVDKAVAPTCGTNGLTEGSHCGVCNVVIVAQQTVAKVDHVWNNGSASGNTITYTCTVCGATEAKEGSAAVAKHVCDHLISGVETEFGRWTACSVCGAKSYAVTAISAYKGSGATHASADVYLPNLGTKNPTVAADMEKQSVTVSDVAITYNITSGADKSKDYVEFTYTITAPAAMTVDVFFNGRSTNTYGSVNSAAQINKFMHFYQGSTEVSIPDSAVLPSYVEGKHYWTEQQIATVELAEGTNTFTFRFTKEGGIYNKGKYYGAYASYFRFAESSVLVEDCEANVHDLVTVAEVAPGCLNGVKEHYICSVCGGMFDIENKYPTEEKYLVIPAIFDHVFENVTRLQEDGSYAYVCTRGCGTTKAHTCTGEGNYLIIAKQPNLVWYEEGDTFNPDRMELYLSTECAEGCCGNTVVAGHLIGYDAITYTYQNGTSFKAGDTYITINYLTYSVQLPVTVTAVGKTITVDNSDEGFIYVESESDDRNAGTRVNDQGQVGQSAYGGSYVNNFANGDSAKFTFTLDEAEENANIVLRACSDRMNGAGGTPPYANAISVNDVVIIKVDGVVVEFSDDVIFEGTVTNLDQKTNRWVWTNWISLDLGTYNLGAGEHTVEIIIDTILPGSVAGCDHAGFAASIQIDCLNIFCE